MHELYEHIWRRHENYNSRHREEGAMFFHCVRLSPLTLFELTVMMDPSLWQHYRDNTTPIDRELIERKCALMERKLTIRTAGLLVCQHRHDKDHTSADITYLHRTVHDFLYGTEQGRIVVVSPSLNMQNLSQRRIYALVAFVMQDYLDLGWHKVSRACDNIAIWEDAECLCLDFATLNWMDCKMEALVRASCESTMFLPWLQELSVEPGRSSLSPIRDFAYLLAYAEANESAQTFIIGKQPSTSYLGHLLAFLMTVIGGASLTLAVTNKSLEFVNWLIEHDADLFVGCKLLLRESHLAVGKRPWNRLSQTPLSLLVGFFCSFVHPRLECPAVMDFIQTTMRKLPGDPTVKVPVLDGRNIAGWLSGRGPAVRELLLFVYMDVHISRLRQTLEATVQEASKIWVAFEVSLVPSMSLTFDMGLILLSLTKLLTSHMDLASIADIDCILVRNRHSAGWFTITVDEKVKNFLFRNLPWGFRDNIGRLDTFETLAAEVLRIGEIQEEVDMNDYLEQRGYLSSEDIDLEI